MLGEMINNPDVANNQMNNTSYNLKQRSARLIGPDIAGTNIKEEKTYRKKSVLSDAIVTLINEGGINFFNYLKKLGLSRDPDLIVLSSKHHYYYDENDLKSVRVIVNLKKLNLIKYLDLFLNSLHRILPQDASFIGYFSDREILKVNGFQFHRVARLTNRLNDILNTGTEHFLCENDVSELLEKNGFKIVDMTKMNGLVYFNSRTINTEKKYL